MALPGLPHHTARRLPRYGYIESFHVNSEHGRTTVTVVRVAQHGSKQRLNALRPVHTSASECFKVFSVGV